MTTRTIIKNALGDNWTKELEDKLFLPVSEFGDERYKSGRTDALMDFQDGVETLIQKLGEDDG